MANKMNPVQKLCDFDDAVIANGASLSGAFNLMGRIPAGIYMPAAWTAAGLSFQVSYDDVTYYNLRSLAGAAEYTAAAAADEYVPLDFTLFYGVRFVKVRSGTLGTPVNQGAARTLVLSCGIPAIDQ